MHVYLIQQHDMDIVHKGINLKHVNLICVHVNNVYICIAVKANILLGEIFTQRKYSDVRFDIYRRRKYCFTQY